MRLPNGYGSVYKLSGKRRNPWVAAKTVGYKEDKNGKIIREYNIIGYYSTKKDGLQALADFNDNPYDINLSRVTFSEIYNRWYSETFNDDSNKSTVRNYEAAYKHCKILHNMIMADIKPNHMQAVLDGIDGGYQTVKRVHTLFNKLYEWCIAHDCIKKNYAKLTKINVKCETATRERFSSDEIQKLWNNLSQNENIALILILIYSGVRINELLELKKEDVDFERQCFDVRASKTTAGIRTVPIADKLLPMWQDFYNKSKCDYVFSNTRGERLVYDNFKRRYWLPLMQEMNMSHTPHETRHTFISIATSKNINPTLIKKMVGHKSIMSLTERVYTHPEIKEMVDAVNLMIC